MSGFFGRPVENEDSQTLTVWISRMTCNPGLLVLTVSLSDSDATDSCQLLRDYDLLHHLHLIFIKTDPLKTSRPITTGIEKYYQNRY